jgi:hypothetical protein
MSFGIRRDEYRFFGFSIRFLEVDLPTAWW